MNKNEKLINWVLALTPFCIWLIMVTIFCVIAAHIN